LQRNIYASTTAYCPLAGPALLASPTELLAQAAQQQENPCAAYAHFGPLIFTRPPGGCLCLTLNCTSCWTNEALWTFYLVVFARPRRD